MTLHRFSPDGIREAAEAERGRALRFVPPLNLQRAPRPMIRALITGMAFSDLVRVFADEAVSALTKETAHALAIAIEREIDRRA
jgi:hypothetical protein